MNKNVGSLDQKIRFVLGAGLLSMFVWAPDNLKWWGLSGLVLIGTALINWCPIYWSLGLRTRPKQ